MELTTTEQPLINGTANNMTENKTEAVSTDKLFIQANTIGASLEEVRDGHIIPVFSKDNEPVISQVEFIETVQEVALNIRQGNDFKPLYQAFTSY